MYFELSMNRDYLRSFMSFTIHITPLNGITDKHNVEALDAGDDLFSQQVSPISKHGFGFLSDITKRNVVPTCYISSLLYS